MIEIALVLAIVGAALVFLVRQFVRSVRGTGACSGCACANQACQLHEAVGQGSTADRSDKSRIADGTPGDTGEQRAAAR